MSSEVGNGGSHYAATSTDWGGFFVEHRLTIRATCPADGSEDVYNTIISAARTIPVEELVVEAGFITDEGPIYQEDLTRELARRLGVEVVTHGIHSGVYTTCRCRG